MDMVKFILSEICCLLKSSFDISMQKIEQLFKRNKTGL
jgi:hypothetical protein